MIIKEKERSEIENTYKWDLSSIYSSELLWEEDYEKVKIEMEQIVKYKNNILNSADNLYSFLCLYFNLSRKLGKLYTFAHLNYDSDTKNDNFQIMKQKMNNLYQKYGELTNFIDPEFLKQDYKIIEQYMLENTKLKEYENYLKEVYRFKEHTLSEQEEYILSKLSKSFSLPSQTYEKLTDSDMRFGTIIDEEGNEVELNDRNYSKYISSNNRQVRRDAFKLLLKNYKNFINTISSTMVGEIDINENIAKLRKYDSAIAMALFEDNIDPQIYDNLINTVSNNLDVLFKYYDLRKDILKLDELHLYDIYTNLINSKQEEYPFEEGKKIVMDSLSVLGPDYVEILKKAFDEKWIDIYSNVGKRSGAYSSGDYDTNPYILLNYQNLLNDVSTLAHELGHSIHSYYSRKNNTYQDSEYKIFVAEVASTVNELLLFKNMLKKSNSKEEKLNILNQLMELFKGTIYRQTMFAEFEKTIYEDNQNGKILTSEMLSNKYYELIKKYFGKNVVVDEEIKYEWARIPHFYYSFYVYKYATGLSAACYIANNILNEKENALENYLKFLKIGGKYYPLEELKIAGVDMNNPEVIESAIKMFSDTIEEFKEVYNSNEEKEVCKKEIIMKF